MARRSSLKAQLTSTPRLSMKQKVKLDMELMKRRRISLLSPPDEYRITSSEEDNGEGRPADKCVCRPTTSTSKGKPQRVTRRDSLIYSSPRRKKKPASLQRAQTTLDRTTISKLQKLKRQKTFNQARDELQSIDGNHDSLMWDDEYDMLDLDLAEGTEEFVVNNDEAIQGNFETIIEAERCDGEDLFEEIKATPRAIAIIVNTMEKGEGGQQQQPKRRSPTPPPTVTTTAAMRSFDQSGTSIQNKSYSINSGICNESKLPMASVVHFSPRDDRAHSPRSFLNGFQRADLNLVPLSQQNLLQLIVIVLVGIFFCIFYQNIVF